MFRVLAIVICLQISSYCLAQVNKFNSPKIGDRVPEMEFKLVNNPGTIKLSNFRGKLLILDFWATWCSACIGNFNKMDALQKKFEGRLQVLLVNTKNTGDNESKVKTFLKKWKQRFPEFKLETAINDTIAEAYFYHKEIPHYVWIGPDGTIKAITASEEVNSKNIEKALSKQILSVQEKKDFFPDRLLYIGGEQLKIDDALLYSSIFKKGKLEGLRPVNTSRYVNGAARGHAMRNVSLLEMYAAAIQYNKKNNFRNYPFSKRLVFDVYDSLKLIFDSHNSTIENWEKENLYTYDIIVPSIEEDSIYNYMIKDLNHYSSFEGQITKRKIKCMALIRTSNVDKIVSNGGIAEYRLYNDEKKKYMRNTSLREFIGRLDRSLKIDGSYVTDLPIIDETGYMNKVDLEIFGDVTNLINIRIGLRRYDLDLIEVEREIEVFVITEKGFKGKE